MKNIFLKCSGAVFIFYTIWLLVLPLCFRVFEKPLTSAVKKKTGIKIERLRIYTNITPSLKIKAGKIAMPDNHGSSPADLSSLKLDIGFFPKIHITSIGLKNADLTVSLKDKLYLGDFPIEINNDLKPDKIKTEKFKINIYENGNLHKINGENIYYKNRKKTFILKGNLDFISEGSLSKADFDINLPKNNSRRKAKLNVNLKNLNLVPFSSFVSHFAASDIVKTQGTINLVSTAESTHTVLKDVKIIYKDNNKSMIFPEKFEINSKHRIIKDTLETESLSVVSDGINCEFQGVIKNIYSKTPLFDLKSSVSVSDMRKGALILPPLITPDINIPKLKEYPFYGRMKGELKIKGLFPNPDIFGNLAVSDGVLIKPILNASKNADININFAGQKLFLNVTVPAGGREMVYVTGDITIYGEKYAHLKIKSTPAVDLKTAEFVLNPLHEILCFIIGPVPIMNITGKGNAELYIEGTKKDPHIWGDFNFKNASASFNQISNLTLQNASGSLKFNNQTAHFINKTGSVHSKPAKIDGTCTLFGDLDFNVTLNGQNLSDLTSTISTSEMLAPVKSLVPPISDIKGRCDFNLNLKGKIPDINYVEVNKNIFPKGHITLIDNSLTLHGVKLKNIKGKIFYDKSDCTFDLESTLTAQSKAKAKGCIKNGIADIAVNAPRLSVNELIPEISKYIGNLYVKLNAKYKGSIDKIEPGGVSAAVEILKNNSISGKITLNNSNLNIENLKGRITQIPFNLNLNIKNIGKKSVNLENAKFNGEFNCGEFNLSTINYIKNAHILPLNLQNELDKINFVYGNANVKAVVKNNRLNSLIKMNTVKFDYKAYENEEKPVTVPVKLINGEIAVKNNAMFLNKFNGLIDNMPIFLSGRVDNLYKNPKYSVKLSSKLVQNVFDKYWNAYNIYPVKMTGDIIYSSLISGDRNSVHIQTNLRMEENSSIYYMGVTAGDTVNPITVDFDAIAGKNGEITVNSLKYNKLISSQNNRKNSLPLVSVSGRIKKSGEVYLFKDLAVKTENPANANFFNVIFKKPTIKQGQFTSDLIINGTSAAPKIIGSFDVKNMEMPYLNTTVKELSLDFKPDFIHVNARGDILSNYITVNGKIKNHLVPPYKISDTDIYTNDFDINQSVNKLKQIELNGLSSAISADIGNENILNSVMFDNLKIRAGNIKVKNIRASNLEAVCSLDEKMQLRAESFKFNTAKGIITGHAGYNVLNNFMKMELNAKDVDANELTLALFDLPNQISGSLTGHIEFNCNAKDDKTKAETLTGEGTFSVTDGKMPKLGSLEYLLKAGNLFKGGITSLSMNGIIDIITPMKTGEFSNINGRLSIKDGIAKTIEINTHGKDLNLYMTGMLNLNTRVAEMKVFGQISRKISTVLGAAGNISLNTLFNKIPGISLDKDSPFLNDLNKIPGIELSNKASRKFVVEISGDIDGEDFVKSFKWIN